MRYNIVRFSMLFQMALFCVLSASAQVSENTWGKIDVDPAFSSTLTTTFFDKDRIVVIGQPDSKYKENTDAAWKDVKFYCGEGGMPCNNVSVPRQINEYRINEHQERLLLLANNQLFSSFDQGRAWYLEKALTDKIDSEKKFLKVKPSNQDIFFYSMSIVEKQNIFLLAVLFDTVKGEPISSYVWHSSNGKNWISETPTLPAKVTKIFFSDNNNGWIVGQKNLLLRTTDGGKSWKPAKTNLNNSTSNLRDIYFKNNKLGWIVGTNGVIMKTTDGGDSWWPPVSIDGKQSDYSFRKIAFITDNIGWAFGSKGVILFTEDGGDHWSRQPVVNSNNREPVKNFAEELYNIYVIPTRNDNWISYIVGDKGTILKNCSYKEDCRNIEVKKTGASTQKPEEPLKTTTTSSSPGTKTNETAEAYKIEPLSKKPVRVVCNDLNLLFSVNGISRVTNDKKTAMGTLSPKAKALPKTKYSECNRIQNTFFLRTQNGFFYSSDNGENWDLLQPGNSNSGLTPELFKSSIIASSDQKTVYVLVSVYSNNAGSKLSFLKNVLWKISLFEDGIGEVKEKDINSPAGGRNEFTGLMVTPTQVLLVDKEKRTFLASEKIKFWDTKPLE